MQRLGYRIVEETGGICLVKPSVVPEDWPYGSLDSPTALAVIYSNGSVNLVKPRQWVLDCFPAYVAGQKRLRDAIEQETNPRR